MAIKNKEPDDKVVNISAHYYDEYYSGMGFK
jgi:hypothetical protein